MPTFDEEILSQFRKIGLNLENLNSDHPAISHILDRVKADPNVKMEAGAGHDKTYTKQTPEKPTYSQYDKTVTGSINEELIRRIKDVNIEDIVKEYGLTKNDY